MRSDFTRFFVMTFLVVAMSGCATMYQPNAWTGGYKDYALGNNTYEVWFGGNGHTKKDKVVEFALLRSAEVTLEEGFKYFTILESKTDSSYKYEYTSYGHINIIQCFNEEPVGIQTPVYNAKKIRSNLQKKYQLGYTRSIDNTGELG